MLMAQWIRNKNLATVAYDFLTVGYLRNTTSVVSTKQKLIATFNIHVLYFDTWILLDIDYFTF